jgi:uncharacterized membrane protein
MAHMALDHASLFWNRDRFADEFWPGHPPVVDLANFLARFSGFPVAPGFAFMAGFMIAVTGAARRERGVTDASIRNRLLIRAALLVGLELVFFSLAMGHAQMGVLTALGAGLAVAAFVHRAPLRMLAPVSLAVLLLHPLLRVFWTDRMDFGGVVIKVIHQAGRHPGFDVYYPLIPWIAVVLFGIVVGRLFLDRGSKDWPWFAAAGLAVFIVTRFTGLGSANDFDRVFSYEFFIWSKYPPDLPWLSASFAVLLATLFLLERHQDHPAFRSAPAEFIATFGRTPLFFYALHFALLWLTRPATRHGLGAAILVWGALLVVLWWPCRLWHARQFRG